MITRLQRYCHAVCVYNNLTQLNEQLRTQVINTSMSAFKTTKLRLPVRWWRCWRRSSACVVVYQLDTSLVCTFSSNCVSQRSCLVRPTAEWRQLIAINDCNITVIILLRDTVLNIPRTAQCTVWHLNVLCSIRLSVTAIECLLLWSRGAENARSEKCKRASDEAWEAKLSWPIELR